MGFLLKRSRQLARAGWRDEFNRANEVPIKQPWNPWGDATDASIISNQLRVYDSSSFFGMGPRGGWGYEFSPLTPNWGYEWSMKFSNTNLNGQFLAFISQNWTGSAGPDSLKYQTFLEWSHYQTSTTSGTPPNQTTTYTQHYEAQFNLNDKDSILDQPKRTYFTMTLAQFAASHVWKLRVFNDQTFALMMDGACVYLYKISSSGEDANYIRGPGVRAANFRSWIWNTDIDYWWVYDILNQNLPWTQFFYDDFNRANGAVANGWTILGAAGQIASNSYAPTGSSDGGKAIIRNTGITTGNHRIEGVLGGSTSPSGHEQALILCSNAAGTQGLAARVSSGNAKIFRFSSVLTGNPPTWTQLGAFNAVSNNVAGEKIIFETYDDGTAIVWKGTDVLAYAENVFAVVAKANSYDGCFVSRSAFTNSGSWNDCKILQR